MFWRNMLADFGGRSGYNKSPGNFTPYFLYKIGKYQPDEYLYFPNEPFSLRYKNEIFNKLFEYNGFDIIKYLDFHYAAYPGKEDFLRFLHYEISERLKVGSNKSRNLKMQSALDWVTEKKENLRHLRESDLKLEIKQGVQEIVTSEYLDTQKANALIQSLTDKLSSHLERIMTRTEEGIKEMTGSFVTGNVQLNNQNHKEKLVQLFILLQGVQAPSKRRGGNGEPLFRKFANMDIASILFLHFDAFKEVKIGTVHTDVGKQAATMNESLSATSSRLQEALQEFFYH